MTTMTCHCQLTWQVLADICVHPMSWAGAVNFQQTTKVCVSRCQTG